MKLPFLTTAAVLTIVSALAQAQEAEPTVVSKEQVHETATRIVYSDGTIKLDIKGRPRNNPMTFLPTPEPVNPEPKPTDVDRKRGYLLFVPLGRDGVLPEYRPAAGEIVDRISVFASPAEYELATFCLRPLQDLADVKFDVGTFKNAKGEPISGITADLYVLRPTIEQYNYAGSTCRWQAKWLQPTDTGVAMSGQNLQVVVDVHASAKTSPGIYAAEVSISPRDGQPGRVTIELEVLPLTLHRPISWGFYRYDWKASDDKRTEWILWQLREMRRAGMTRCSISPLHIQTRPDVQPDGSIDFSVYDRAVELYEQAGFEDPPVIAMEGLMFSIGAAMGKVGELGFKDRILGVKAEEVPDDVREFTARAIRKLYDHSLEVKWPPFYIYLADEPSIGSPKMEAAKLMYGLARKVAPEMRTAGTVYTHAWWKPLEGLLDLNIAHYVHPCNNADGNRRWRELAASQNAKLLGIDFIGSLDNFWEGRQITLTAEKGQLGGMMCWTQSVAEEVADDLDPHPYFRLEGWWQGGPWCMRQKNGRVWRSMAWLGLREGIDDSRYVRTARALIDKAMQSSDPLHRAAGEASRLRVEMIMERVPWIPGVRRQNSPWSSAGADHVRRELAQIALDLQIVLSKE